MKALLLMRVANSAKTEVKIVVGVVAVILVMPILTVLVVLHSSLSFLSVGKATADALYQGPVSTTDLYEWGNCTYWAALLRQQAKDPVPNTWGNANTWALKAGLDGYIVDHSPAVGAIMQTSSGKLGHVAYVTAVDPATGAWTISEMNVKGLDIVDTRTNPAATAQNYNFIHDKEKIL